MSIKIEQEQYWEKRGPTSSLHYWEHKLHKKRSKGLASILENYDFSSVYEVGANSGRNLWRIRQKFPHVRLGGLDINAEAIEFAKANIPDASLDVMSIYDIDVEDKYDIVFTAGVLMHIPPDCVSDVIHKCAQKANKFVIHIETYGIDSIVNGPKELKPTKKKTSLLRCVHNYKRIYNELGLLPAIDRVQKWATQDASHVIITNTHKYT